VSEQEKVANLHGGVQVNGGLLHKRKGFFLHAQEEV